MKIAIGADHAGFELKDKIKKFITKQGIEVEDLGTNSSESVDYPDYALKVAHVVAAHKADFGVLVCGSGIGMAITANKVLGIRATTATTEQEAQLSREHNDANVLAIGARLLRDDEAIRVVDAFLKSSFAHGRHTQRVAKIEMIEREEAKTNK
ncbi:MAG TPA: ribose 5-phosphate isomerase B [Terriglobales bacterium]|nr:ribose 5-phosphate isomerase B [Terriglobales bacterium]